MDGNYQILHLFEKCTVCHKDIKTEDPIIVYERGKRLAYHCACFNLTSSTIVPEDYETEDNNQS